MAIFNSIMIVSDFLCTKESEQESNLKWLKHLLNRPLSQAVGKPHCLPQAFSREIFFKYSDIKCSLFAKHFYYEASDISSDSLEYLHGFINKETLVLGYEFSPQTRQVLELAGITYIDIWLHPVRFLDDILFAMRSNNERIQVALQSDEVDQTLFYTYADLLRVQNYRGFRRLREELIPNSALFIGQLLDDKAIMKNGSFLTLLNFKEQFKALTKSHDHVYYIRHPFLKSGDEMVLKFVEGFKNASLLFQPTYHLLASDEVETVATISSSVATEALFFEKHTMLYHIPAVEIREKQPKRYTSIDQSLLFANFWRKILKDVMKVSPLTKHIELTSKKDRLRDALSFYWGYRDIDKVESLKLTVSKMLERKAA